MGNYSLDAFERYPLVKLRPVMTAPREQCYQLLTLRWSQLEPELGVLLSPPEPEQPRVILQLELDLDRDLAQACGFVRRMGSCYAGGEKLLGVVLRGGNFRGPALEQLLQAYRQGFDATDLLAQPGTAWTALCARASVPMGLWLPLSVGILNLRRSIAQENLARNWENAPVYVFSGGTLSEQERLAACRWHASGADVMAPLGAQMTLRRMMFPRELTSGDVLPLRMWWQNLGTAPTYHDAQVKLVVKDAERQYPILVPGIMMPRLGDSMLNTTAQLPKLPGGTYSLWVGLEVGNKLVPLMMDAPQEKGLYRIGQIRLDDVPRPHLRTMWQTQYADGYYPLEDPAQPE